jgi:hypothetical protein
MEIEKQTKKKIYINNQEGFLSDVDGTMWLLFSANRKLMPNYNWKTP